MKFFTLLALGAKIATGVIAQTCTTTITSVIYVTSTVAQPAATTWMNTIPEIDVCGPGAGSGGVSCPGAGSGGYFYRCCSSAGHCGPKNTLQGNAQYCGAGCQPGFGLCDPDRPAPPDPTTEPTFSTDSTCGPIVNKKCPTGRCCSGSNFCGTDIDFCGAANWCQWKYGRCD